MDERGLAAVRGEAGAGFVFIKGQFLSVPIQNRGSIDESKRHIGSL